MAIQPDKLRSELSTTINSVQDLWRDLENFAHNLPAAPVKDGGEPSRSASV
jgi:hypothetical protein